MCYDREIVRALETYPKAVHGKLKLKFVLDHETLSVACHVGLHVGFSII